jgi:hypothetical protein
MSHKAAIILRESHKNKRTLSIWRLRFVTRLVLISTLAIAAAGTRKSLAAITTGSEESARRYYRSLPATIGFSTTNDIFKTTLDDVATYLGYAGITAADLQNLSPALLMNPSDLLAKCADPSGKCSNTLQNTDSLAKALGAVPIRPDDILVTRFFAPKIMDIKAPEATRKIGWRKLVRLRARSGSEAQKHQIGSGIILFNILTEPGATPFSPTDESFNTQVMLITDASSVPVPGKPGPATLYWLDYGKISKGGLLSLELTASFESNDLPQPQAYYVPDGCVACHGNNSQRSMVNYLDTDHWADRLEPDFPSLKASGLPLLVDAKTNDTSATSYKLAFDVIRRFNEEADAQVIKAQPKHDEALSSRRWLDLHKESVEHFEPVERATGVAPLWSRDKENDVKLLASLNQYCFRCHGTIKFSVFDRKAVQDLRPFILQRIQSGAPKGVRMPPDRDLPEADKKFLTDFLPRKGKT